MCTLFLVEYDNHHNTLWCLECYYVHLLPKKIECSWTVSAMLLLLIGYQKYRFWGETESDQRPYTSRWLLPSNIIFLSSSGGFLGRRHAAFPSKVGCKFYLRLVVSGILMSPVAVPVRQSSRWGSLMNGPFSAGGGICIKSRIVSIIRDSPSLIICLDQST